MGGAPCRQAVLSVGVALAISASALVGAGGALAPSTAHGAKCAHSDVRPGKLGVGKLERAIKCLIDKRRRDRGRGRLKVKPSMRSAAVRHSRVMVRRDCFEHQCPGEKDLSGRLSSSGYLPCNCTWRIAENIAWGDGGRGSARSISRAWMNSSKHRENILTRRFEHVGVGVRRGRPGRAGSSASVTVTTVFGFRD